MGNYKSVIKLWPDKETGKMLVGQFTPSGVMFHKGSGFDIGDPPWVKQEAGQPKVQAKNLAVKIVQFGTEKRAGAFDKLGKGATVLVEGSINFDTKTGNLEARQVGDKIYVDFQIKAEKITILTWGEGSGAPEHGVSDVAGTDQVDI